MPVHFWDLLLYLIELEVPKSRYACGGATAVAMTTVIHVVHLTNVSPCLDRHASEDSSQHSQTEVDVIDPELEFAVAFPSHVQLILQT